MTPAISTCREKLPATVKPLCYLILTPSRYIDDHSIQTVLFELIWTSSLTLFIMFVCLCFHLARVPVRVVSERLDLEP